MSKFDPPKPQALAPAELVQTIARFGADAAGVAKAVELIQIQEALKAQDEADLHDWAKLMVSDGSNRALAALRNSGFNELGEFLGADLAPSDISDPLPASESRIENRRIILPTGLEDQFSTTVASASQVTRRGAALVTPEAALETATADVATYYLPKSRFVDELPMLSATAGLAGVAGFSLSGNVDPLGLIVGFIVGAIMSLALNRLGTGFPGIFALTTFGVVGARVMRGLLSAAILLAMTSQIPRQLQPTNLGVVGASLEVWIWGGVILLSVVIGLGVSARNAGWLRVALSMGTLLALLAVALIGSNGFTFIGANFTWLNFFAGLAWGALLNSAAGYSTTSGGWRFSGLSSGLSALTFGVFALQVRDFSADTAGWAIVVTVFLATAMTFAASSTSAARFWSVTAGAIVGTLAISASMLVFSLHTDIIALMLGLTASWLAVIGFDAIARRGKLHLASLNRSFGFYGAVGWLSLLVWLLSGILGASLAIFSPLAMALPSVFTAPVVSFALALIFSLTRIPIVRAQEDEIVMALSRSGASNQVGIS